MGTLLCPSKALRIVRRRASHWDADDFDQTDEPADRTKDGCVPAIVNRFFKKLSASPTDEDFSITYCDLFWLVVSIVSRIISIATNIILALNYFHLDRIDYFTWTVSCIVIPMLITIALQIALYMEDIKSIKEPPVKWSICGTIWLVILIPYLFRYCQTLSYSIAYKKAERMGKKLECKRYRELIIHEDSDIALIRIFECFLESAPQKILQISIILSGYQIIIGTQIISIAISVLNMAWCIASYHRSIRWSQIDKINISWTGTMVQWSGYFLISLSRVLSIAIIASLFPKWTLIGCVVHAFTMGAWIFLFDRSPFCSSNCVSSAAFSLVLGMVFVFNYILPKARRTRYRYGIFYSICFLENCGCVTLFLMYSSTTSTTAPQMANTFIWLLCVAALVPFVLGIGFMMLYYRRFHPNVRKAVEIPALE